MANTANIQLSLFGAEVVRTSRRKVPVYVCDRDRDSEGQYAGNYSRTETDKLKAMQHNLDYVTANYTALSKQFRALQNKYEELERQLLINQSNKTGV